MLFTLVDFNTNILFPIFTASWVKQSTSYIFLIENLTFIMDPLPYFLLSVLLCIMIRVQLRFKYNQK